MARIVTTSDEFESNVLRVPGPVAVDFDQASLPALQSVGATARARLLLELFLPGPLVGVPRQKRAEEARGPYVAQALARGRQRRHEV